MNYRYEQRFEFNGQLLTRSEIARMTGVSRSTLYNRMKQGHSVSEAVAMGMTKADEIAAEHRKEKDGYWCAMCEYQEDVDRCAFCEDKSEFRKDWKFLTEGEVSKIRNDQCRNCKHVATNGGDSKVGKEGRW